PRPSRAGRPPHPGSHATPSVRMTSVRMTSLCVTSVHSHRKVPRMRTRVRHARTTRFGIPAIAAVAVAGLALSLLTAPVAQAQSVVVISSDFEDGTTQGWGPRAGETVTVTAAAARSGEFGLSITDRTQTWEGPTLDLLGIAEAGVRYDISVWVRLAA